MFHRRGAVQSSVFEVWLECPSSSGNEEIGIPLGQYKAYVFLYLLWRFCWRVHG